MLSIRKWLLFKIIEAKNQKIKKQRTHVSEERIDSYVMENNSNYDNIKIVRTPPLSEDTLDFCANLVKCSKEACN